jgi:hypothetical protein
MSQPEPVEVPYIERVRLEPGDILVLTYPAGVRITAEIAVALKEKLRVMFDFEVPIVILDKGGRFQVITSKEA